MPIDSSLIGREFPPTPPLVVTAAEVTSFASATGSETRRVPATFPIVVTFRALLGFLEAEQVELARIVHGEQRFTYERPIVIGDELSATLSVTGLRQIEGTDILRTTSTITDAAGELVCTAGATLVHRADA
ncbi:FAS1-like dehydratase domain-containing protein [Nocardioides bizhenqiangii]|uniref:MaoC family dehydratase N-terminal domain-containing protein n=1 Tax=Nocardioides bizhenqiangii TaxID=3095076 RepID=A0ABZ0ZTR0_9ACTN|nr:MULTISPECIES: MaoC family dehydratase N-terminal domain-containing protein [unclassified Nocardioides]MDZ5622785.1 MaoC family dehydratase N-terminal domain-containing protein [Nocardioides sp. HM23]WQQ27047.1 MaoC family dehydratase N-terminal domain-containing protein [Nocardioides sp. HM61]